MYAIVQLQGHQYIVTKNMDIVVDKIKTTDKEFVIDTVLCLFEDNKLVSLGNPYVKGAKVICTRLEDKKGDKITVKKFRRKTRYERTIWFRPQQTVLHVNEIVVDGK